MKPQTTLYDTKSHDFNIDNYIREHNNDRNLKELWLYGDELTVIIQDQI